jgi:hypothetical protein
MHSKAPWRIAFNQIYDANNLAIATIQSHAFISRGRRRTETVHLPHEANAKLIMSAPYLLRACKLALEHAADPQLKVELEAAIRLGESQ